MPEQLELSPNAAPDVEKTLAPADVDKALARSVSSGIGFGLRAENWDHGFRIAKVLANSALVPKAYQGKPEDVVVAMQCGAEIGLPPMASLYSIGVINGRPGLYGDGFLGVIMSSPAYFKHVEFYIGANGEKSSALTSDDLTKDATIAVSMFWRKGIPDAFVGTFSIADAKRAKLWGKDGPWTQYPARQMKWRARGFAGRDGFAAELRGIRITAELEDIVDDIEPTEIALDRIVAPVRRSEKPAPPAPPPSPTPKPSTPAPMPPSHPTPTPTTPPPSPPPRRAVDADEHDE